MEKVLDYIRQNNLINEDEIIGVAVSGGRDSMALLHFLHEHADELGCRVVAIT